MSKELFWIRMNYSDMTARTYHLSDAQYGLLHRLYAVYWERGYISSDMNLLLKHLHKNQRSAKAVQELLDEFFFIHEDHQYHNEWMLKEIENASRFGEIQSKRRNFPLKSKAIADHNNTVEYSKEQYNTIQNNTVDNNTEEYSTEQRLQRIKNSMFS